MDLSNLNKLEYLFRSLHEVQKIEGINKSKIDKRYSMIEMFKGCNELKYINLTNIDTLNEYNMKGLFRRCYKLKEIKGINTLNTFKVENMREMFEDCEELKNLDLSIDTSNAVLMKECSKIDTI